MPSKVCSRSSDVVNHHKRCRGHDEIAPNTRNGCSQPHSAEMWSRLQKSNWISSPGSVWIGTDTAAAARNRGPRTSRTARTTVG